MKDRAIQGKVEDNISTSKQIHFNCNTIRKYIDWGCLGTGCWGGYLDL